MEVVLIDDTRKSEWEEYLQRNPFSIAWQSYEWCNVLRRHYRFKFFPLAAIDQSYICGILPLYHMKGAFSKDSLISVPYAVAGGIVADHKEAQDLLLQKAIQISGKYNDCVITLKQYKVKMPGELRLDENYYNRELALTSDVALLRAAISDDNKQKIADAEKYNPLLEYPSLDIASFYKILFGSQLRKGIPCVSRKWIEDLVKFKMYSISFLRVNGSVVAATMVKEFKDTISFPFSCTHHTGGKGSLFLFSLYWKLILLFASQGKQIFHSGRIPTSDDTDDYRLGWGGKKHSYYYQYYPKGVAQTEFSKRRGKKRRIMETCWKSLPPSIARIIGPHVVKRFP
jgi:serine/alanine adding enzyme